MWVEEVADVSERLEQGVKRSGTYAPQVCLKLGEGHLDGIEIGAVSRQEQEPAAALSQSLRRLWAFVSGQIVEDDNGSRFKRRGQLRLDIGVEGRPVHWAIDHPRCDQSVLRQPGDEGLCAPFAEGCGAIEALSDRCPPPQSGEVRLHSGLVNEDQSVWLLAHTRLSAPDPVPASLTQRGPITFRRDQTFFYMTAPCVRGRGAARRAAHPRHVSQRGPRPIP